MAKELVYALHVIANMFLMGGLLAQHEKAKELMAYLDSGFLSFLKLIKDQKPLIITQFILKFFGAIAIIGFLGIICLGLLDIQSDKLFLIFTIALIASGLLSGSLFWVLHHKEVLKRFLKLLLFFGGGSLTMPLTDFLCGTNMTQYYATMLAEVTYPLFNYTPSEGLLYETLYISSIYGGIVVFLYITSWIYAAPIAILACSIIAIPIWGARMIDRVFPTKPVVVIYLVLWFYSLTYLTFAS